MKPIIITVALCVKNNESTIRETIDSIVSQDFPSENMETIVVDGCSEDNTLFIIKNILSKSNIPARFYSENKGLSFARQIVVNNSKGKYIIWADGDLVFSKNYLKKQHDFMETHPTAAIVAGIQGVIPNDNWIATLESISYVVESLKNVGKKTTNLLGTKGTIFRTKVIKKIGGFDLNIKGSQEDTDLSYRLSLAGWTFFVNNVLFFENQRTTWNEIWKRHVWYGYGLHFFSHKHRNRNMFINKSNDTIIFSSIAYKITHKKVVFLLPINFLFRRIALFSGFLKAHLSGYGHDN